MVNFTGNYIIRFTHSTDGGNTFSDPVNLTSRNGLLSLYSPIFPSKNGIYAVWDTQNGSIYSDVYFANSTDNGNTFSDPINLSKNTYTKKTGCSRTTRECKEMEEKTWL